MPGKEIITSIAIRRRVWWTFRKHCFDLGLAAQPALEGILNRWLEDRGLILLRDDELPPQGKRVRRVAVMTVEREEAQVGGLKGG